MNSSLKLFSVRGIDIRLHITFPLILVWAAFQFGLIAGLGLTGALFGIITISLLFVLVTLHELGHSFAALHYGVPVKQIVLLPIGGVAQLREMPDKPVQEFVIAIAGPAVNVLIAILMGMAAIAFRIPIVNPIRTIGSLSLTAVFSYVFVYNIVLAVFNLLPAFPMDGGRILRAVMAMRLPYVRATSIAVNIGRALAVFLGLYGLVSGGFFLMLIAFFVYTGATQEGRMVQTRGLLRGYTVQQAYSQRVGLLNPYDTIQRAVAMKLSGIQSSFPVSEYGNYVGFLTDAKLMQTLQMSGTHIPVHAVMSRDVQPVSLNSDLFDVQRRMQSEGLTALPVVEAGRVIGMITLRHIRELARMVTIRPDVISRVQSV